MPTQLAGKRETRKATALVYASRADAAAAQARSLVGLEAENAYWRFVEATRNVKAEREAAAAARRLNARMREAAGVPENRDDMLINEVTVGRALASLNEALYDQISALANLERTTAGGVTVNFPGRFVGK
jgi:hypothetical protein